MDLNLRERTVVLLGPTGSTMQNLVMALTQHGADVALVDADAAKMQRFCTSVSDQREVNPKFGRAAAFPVDFSNAASLKDALGKAAQTFGSIDVFVDALSEVKPSPFQVGSENVDLEKIIHQNLTISLKATEYVSGFLKGRKRGRIVYLLQDSMNRGVVVDAAATAARTGLIAFAKALARQLQDSNVTVNCLSLGLTEEYLLGHFPESASIKEAHEKMKAIDPLFKITEPEKIANSILFLCSTSGVAITGQHIVLS